MNVAQEHFRLAELAARTGLEPKLGQRFDRDPAGVLLEFGLEAQGMDWEVGEIVSIDDLSTSFAGPVPVYGHCTCMGADQVDVQVAA